MSDNQEFILRNVDIVRHLNPKNISEMVFESKQVTFSSNPSFGQNFLPEMNENDKLLFGLLLVVATQESEYISIGYDPVDNMTVFGCVDYFNIRLFFKPQSNGQCRVFSHQRII